jgi:hypothetical protein
MWVVRYVVTWLTCRWVLNQFDVQLTNADWLRELLSVPDIKFNRSLESFKVMHRLLGTSLLGCQV